MATQDADWLQQLAERYGIVAGYHDIWGHYHPTDDTTRRAILAAMGVATDCRAAPEQESNAPPASMTGAIPDRGYQPPCLAAGERIWGVNLALYGLRSSRNWGVGDFADLAQVADWAAQLGADFVGLLPLHHLFNAPPYGISPYFPSSRLFLNPLYIALEQLSATGLPAPAPDAEQRQRLEALRAVPLVDYAAVWQLKWEVLAKVFARCQQSGARWEEFCAWRTGSGQALEDFATFCALRDHQLDAAGNPLPWPQWPDALRRPTAEAVVAFRRQHRGEVTFHAWLQWLADDQLRAVQDRCRQLGMRIGLYLDTALGVDPCGADAWLYQDVLARGASAGAPPDPFSLLGQRWGVPPAIPRRHRASGYRFLRDSLGHNAARAGALRVDHVLAFWRLFWVPEGLPPAAGAYVQENAGELLAVARQVSQQHRCLIVGEDLGTVPPEARRDLQRSGLYSYRVLIFEKDANGFFHPPGSYPQQALVAVTTHDLPPLDSFWLGCDLDLKQQLERYPDTAARDHDREVRRWDRYRLQEKLQQEGLWPADAAPTFTVSATQLDDLAVAVHAFLARTPAQLLLVNTDDLLGETEMQNLPGTLDEHPNWQRKATQPLETWTEHARPARVAAAIRAQGRGRG